MKYLLLIAILLGFLALSLGSSLRESLTYDEIVHLEEGINHLKYQTFAVDTNNPPFVRELTALPQFFGLKQPVYARLVTILLGELLLLSVFFFSKKYFGIQTALLSAFLLAFEPTFLAHSHYVTLEVGFALFFFLAWWAYCLRRILLFGALFGLAAASRVSAWLFMIGVWYLKYISLKKVFLAVCIAFVVVWASYLFTYDVIIITRPDATRLSSRLENDGRFRSLIYLLKTEPVPLGNYLAMMKNNVIRSAQSPRTFLLPINFFLKTPIPILILMFFFLLKIIRDEALRTKTKVIWIPIAVIFLISSFSGQQPWVRYLLPLYPFLVIAAALAIVRLPKTVSIFLLLWFILGTLVQFPHFISYANEFAGHKDKRFEKLNDSNLDWGQALPDLAQYVREQNSTHVSFSYFGRDNGNDYGLVSNTPWGSYKFEEICAFHEIPLGGTGDRVVAISATNWYQCGYSNQPQFQREKIKDVVADSILIF